jgi:RNA polymerase sigma factor (TIGR02999 family)
MSTGADIRKQQLDAAQSLRHVLAIYPELRRVAAGLMRRERRDHTLQPTALVHEACLRLQRQGLLTEPRHADVMAAAARAMRFILVEHARQKRARKRGGTARRQPLTAVPPRMPDNQVDLLALDEALTRLQELDPERARIVELRFFLGLETGAVATILGTSERTVERGWRAARTWLYHALNEGC